MATQTTEKFASMTDDQATQIKRLLEDSSKHAFAEYLKTNPSIDSAQRIIEQGGRFKARHAELVQEFGATADAKIAADWQKFYKEHFGLDVDFSKVGIPQRPKGNWRLIFIAKGMTMNAAFGGCKRLFTTWQYCDDLDAVITENARSSKKEDYAIWVLDEVEPDKAFRGKSTRRADLEMKIGITVLERIVLELKYFSETGNHLDIKGVTFCSGSRDSGGVPGARWCGGGFKVRWCSLDDSNSDYGIRSAVSL